MPQNFLSCDRDQPLLLPPDLRDWLDDDHLAWFVIDAVTELNLEPFYADYRADGHGAAAHDPKIMVTLFAYAYAVGERSSRGIERRCREDVAFRVICANQAPDHATVARFRARHEEALAELFGGVLGLCAKAGIVDVGVVAVDGTKLAADAADGAIRSYEQIAAEILAEAGRIDAAEDEIHGDAMSCPRDFAPRTAAAPGCGRPRKSSSASEPPPPSRCGASAPSASRPAGGDWPRTGEPSGGQTSAMRPTAPVE
jgi:transposase